MAVKNILKLNLIPHNLALHLDRKGRATLVVNSFFQAQSFGGFGGYYASLPASELWLADDLAQLGHRE